MWTDLQALAQARALDSGPLRWPLHGLPLAVKDLFDTYDFALGYGSPICAEYRPVVSLLATLAVLRFSKSAGLALIVGVAFYALSLFIVGNVSGAHSRDHRQGDRVPNGRGGQGPQESGISRSR